MISSDVKIEKSKLLQKYTYIKTTPYIIEKIKLNQSLQPKQKKILVNSWTVGSYSVYFSDQGQDLNNYKKDEIEEEPMNITLLEITLPNRLDE